MVKFQLLQSLNLSCFKSQSQLWVALRGTYRTNLANLANSQLKKFDNTSAGKKIQIAKLFKTQLEPGPQWRSRGRLAMVVHAYHHWMPIAYYRYEYGYLKIDKQHDVKILPKPSFFGMSLNLTRRRMARERRRACYSCVITKKM